MPPGDRRRHVIDRTRLTAPSILANTTNTFTCLSDLSVFGFADGRGGGEGESGAGGGNLFKADISVSIKICGASSQDFLKRRRLRDALGIMEMQSQRGIGLAPGEEITLPQK